MRLMRLLAVNEVRRTADSQRGESGAKPARNKKHCREAGAHGVIGDGMSAKCVFVNQGDLPWCWKEQSRSQSPRSSDEAGNDRRAKGDRKVEA
jgi:hypothetical protein